MSYDKVYLTTANRAAVNGFAALASKQDMSVCLDRNDAFPLTEARGL